MRSLSFIFMLAGLVLGQVSPEQADSMQYYMATYQTSLSGAGTTFTLQVPASSGKRVYLQTAVLECTVDCTVSQDKNGSAATGTSVAAVGLNTNGTPIATFYRASNAGAGSDLLPIIVRAGVQTALDMTPTVFARGAGTAQNFNWRVSSITGGARVTITWAER